MHCRLRFIMMVGMLALSGCGSSIFTMPTAFMVSMASDRQAIADKRFTYSDKCIVEGRPTAYDMALQVLEHPESLRKYKNILGEEKWRINAPDPSPYEIAYALAVISRDMYDSRANILQMQLNAFLTPEEQEYIAQRVHFKYLAPYLHKCFTVPLPYYYPPGARGRIRW